MSTLRRLDRIDIAHNVRDRHVGGGQLLNKSELPANPINPGLVAMVLDLFLTVRAERVERVVIDLRALDDRDLGVKKVGQLADDPTFCLSAEPKKNEVVLREDCIDDLGYDGFFIAQN